MEWLEITEGQPVQQEGQHGVGEAVGEHRRVLATVHLQHNRGIEMMCVALPPTHLDTLITVVGGDDPVVGEDHVEGVAAPPPLELQRQRGVGLGVPLRHLLEPVQHVAWGGGGYLQFVHSHLVDITCQ